MAYIGAESPSDWLLHDVRKGTRVDQTLAVVEMCRRHGVIPELSFMVAPPQDPEGETEKTFEFIREIKRIHPATEIMIYVYTPLPPSHAGQQGARMHARRRRSATWTGRPVVFPTTADGWAEPQWVDYWCHTDAPWLTNVCAGASSISRPCSAAAFRRSRTSDRRRSPSPRCGAGVVALPLPQV